MTDEEGRKPEALPCEQAMRIAVLVTESYRGNCIACPVASPTHAAYGSETSSTSELERFLETLFTRSRPDTWSHFRVPEQASLRLVEAQLDRSDLPRRNRPTAAITFPAVQLPMPDGSAWAMLPTLRHTVHLEPEEDFDTVVAQEVRRVVAALDLSAWEHVGLLPAREHDILFTDVLLPSSEGPARGMRSLAAAARRKHAVEALEPVATPLHIASRGWKLPPLIGREAAQNDLRALLDGDTRGAVLLTGPAQAGKSALARSWIARTGRLVYQTSGARLVAGMSGLGQWEERVHAVMGALEELNAVLYLEDLEDLLAERVEGGGVDVTAALRPYLEDGRVRLLCEVRSERVDDLERRHWALFAAFTRVAVDPLDADQTLEALRARSAHDAREEPNGPTFSDAALEAIIEIAERYAPYDAFPGKAMRAYVDLRGTRTVQGLIDANAPPIGLSDVYERFSLFTGLPVALLRDDLRLRVDDIAEHLARQVVGQAGAVRALAETIAVVKARLQPGGKPLATFLFVGPTGVGKTELAKALADYLFGSPERMARFDMSEFMTSDAAERLIHGSDYAEGLLTRRVREQPFSVVLLDEIEKAHPAVFDLLLQVCGEGRLTDARGQTTWFHNAIIIMTSNLGARERRARMGFGDAQESDIAYYTRLVHGSFRPEFVNRMDRIVPFGPLSRNEIAAIAQLALNRISRRAGITDRAIHVHITDAAMQQLAADGYDVRYGARALRRHVDETLVSPLARILSKLGPSADGTTVTVAVSVEDVARGSDVVHTQKSGRYRFVLRKSRETNRQEDPLDLTAVASLRREADALMRLPTVEEVQAQVDHLVAQLADPRGRRDRRYQQEIAQLRTEHQRLYDSLAPVQAAYDEILSFEELALLDLLTAEPGASVASEALEAFERMQLALPSVLLSLEPHRDSVTLVLEELEGGAFDPWLVMLLEEVKRRRWQVQLHIDGGAREPSDDWPANRRWGPPRSPERILEALEAKPFRNVLMRCQGPMAAGLLALEAGPHTLIQAPRLLRTGAPLEEGKVFVHLAALDTDFDDKKWEHSALAPPKPTTASRRKRAAAVRELDWSLHEVRVLSRIARLSLHPSDYFARLERTTLAHLVALETGEGGLQRQDAFLPGLSPDEA